MLSQQRGHPLSPGIRTLITVGFGLWPSALPKLRQKMTAASQALSITQGEQTFLTPRILSLSALREGSLTERRRSFNFVKVWEVRCYTRIGDIFQESL